MKNLPDWNLDPRLCIIQSWQTLICVCLRRGQGSLEIPYHHVWCKQWKQKSGVTNWATKALETEHATIIVVKAFPPKDSSSKVSDKHILARPTRIPMKTQVEKFRHTCRMRLENCGKGWRPVQAVQLDKGFLLGSFHFKRCLDFKL